MIVPDFVTKCYPKRKSDSHKGMFGTVLSLAGSDGMPGAAALCGWAALRCGAGKVINATPRRVYEVVAPHFPAAVFAPLDDFDNLPKQLETALSQATALAIGCGLTATDHVARGVLALLEHNKILPTVIDADGINILSAHTIKRETGFPAWVLTPHPGEMARLLGISTADVNADRVAAAQSAAMRYHAVVVLKGEHTVVVDDKGNVYVNEGGNPGMATAGSGDVLTGMVAALLAKGTEPFDAARCAVYLHALAGDRAAYRLSEVFMTAGDIIDALSDLFLLIEAGGKPLENRREQYKTPLGDTDHLDSVADILCDGL